MDGTGICYYEGHPSQSKEGAGQGAWAYHKLMKMRMVITWAYHKVMEMMMVITYHKVMEMRLVITD